MKTLIIVAHPNISKSVINKRFIEELRKDPEKYTVHELTSAYPDGKIDVDQEQKLVEAHDHLVLQFPIQWFSCPPIRLFGVFREVVSLPVLFSPIAHHV